MSYSRTGRVGRMHVILEVTRQLRRREEWVLARLRDASRALAANERELIGTVASEEALHGLFIEAKLRRLDALRREADRLAEDCRRQEERLMDQAGRARNAERLLSDREAQARRSRDQRELQEVVEAILIAHPSSRKPPASSG